MDLDRLERLIDLAAGDLPEAESRTLRTSLEGDPEAQRLLGLFEATRQAARADDTVAPPASVLRNAKGIALRERVARHVREVVEHVAALVFDTRRLASGVRSSVDAEVRQMAYEWNGLRVDLQVESADTAGRHLVIGQLTGEREGYDGVQIVEPAGDASTAVSIDDRGFFEATVAPGTVDLVLMGQAHDVRISDVPVG